MDYKSYQYSRNSAWRILLDCEVKELPVDLMPICKKLGVRISSYRKSAGFIQKQELQDMVQKTEGLTFFVGETPVILYDDTPLPQRIRFTIAHELGHLVLRHVRPGQGTTVNREPSSTDDPRETEANVFAARLLAPACVLWALELHKPEEIAELCRISLQSAKFRAERMEELYKRNKFLSSPLERQLFEQLQPFIKQHKKKHWYDMFRK